MSEYWKFVCKSGKFTFWKSRDGTYQVTKSRIPPSTTAGYATLEAVINLTKGEK